MVVLVVQDYEIVDKKETRILKKTIDECKLIYQCWSVLSVERQKETEKLFNNEIMKKLGKCYEYYEKKYNVKIEKGYGQMKDIEINLSNICEKIKSWE